MPPSKAFRFSFRQQTCLIDEGGLHLSALQAPPKVPLSREALECHKAWPRLSLSMTSSWEFFSLPQTRLEVHSEKQGSLA